MSGAAYKNLEIFGWICGNTALRRVRLVTTMWDKIRDPAVAQNREAQLKGDFWRKLLGEGAVAKRFDNTQSCAWNIVHELLRLGGGGDELLLQEELVEHGKRLNETEAGKVLYSWLQKLLVEQKKTLKELADEAKLQNDPALAKSLQEEYDKINIQLQQTSDEIKEMKISFGRGIFRRILARRDAQDEQSSTSKAHENEAPDSKVYDNEAPDSNAHENEAPDSKVHDNEAPDSKAYNNEMPDSTLVGVCDPLTE